MLHDFIKKTALSIGFDACGIAKADYLEADAEYMKGWLADGNHGEMGYLSNHFEKRTDPRKLVPGCESVVVVLLNYRPTHVQAPQLPRIARYAYSKVDYHHVIKEKLRRLEAAIVQEYGEGVVDSSLQHSFVDSAPVLERRWAERAGLGWIGKHTQLIAPGLGSYCFIGVLLLNKRMQYDEPIRNKCGSCTRCLEACPTQALKEWKLDARKCISYQTIENKGIVDEGIQGQLSGCMLGCDICAEHCPWNNKWNVVHQHPELEPVDEIFEMEYADWVQLSQLDFNRLFKQSAIKRAGFRKVKENIGLLLKKNDS